MVFGGTGFLGRRIVRHLLDANLAVRIASRHPDIALSLFSRDVDAAKRIAMLARQAGGLVIGFSVTEKLECLAMET